MVDGYIGDIGYTASLRPHPPLARAMHFLLELREEIPRLFTSEATPRAVWAAVDRRVVSAGYDNCHAKYPFRVLGHRVYRVPGWLERLPLPRIPLGFQGASWFSLQGQLEFFSRGLFPELLTPEHSGKKLGLWAIEPHIGAQGFGAKFEELLVVEQDRAFWLDDVPHLRWRE